MGLQPLPQQPSLVYLLVQSLQSKGLLSLQREIAEKTVPSTVRSMSYYSCSVPSTADKIIASSPRPSLAPMQDNNDREGCISLPTDMGMNSNISKSNIQSVPICVRS